MFKVRHLIPEDDMALIADLIVEANLSSEYPHLFSTDAKKIEDWLHLSLDRGHISVYLWVDDQKNEYDGIIIGLYGVLHPFHTEFSAIELGWYVRERARKSRAGILLLKSFESWAEKLGAKRVFASSQYGGANVEPLYTSRGYKKIDSIFELRKD